jgi:hypothetical protein
MGALNCQRVRANTIQDTFSKPAKNDFPNMSPLMGLAFLLELVFYKRYRADGAGMPKRGHQKS